MLYEHWLEWLNSTVSTESVQYWWQLLVLALLPAWPQLAKLTSQWPSQQQAPGTQSHDTVDTHNTKYCTWPSAALSLSSTSNQCSVSDQWGSSDISYLRSGCRLQEDRLSMTGSWRRDTVWQVRAWPRRCARQPLRRSSDRRRNILTVSPKRSQVIQSDDNNIIMLSDLLQCTNEPNVSIPTLANLLIERTLNPNWVVVYKSLITIHHLMCYGNEVNIPY